MLKNLKFMVVAVALVSCISLAHADDRLKPYTRAAEYSDLAGASIADDDSILLFDSSAGDWVRTSTEGFAELDTLNGITATTTEINQAADLTAINSELTAAGALDSTDCGGTFPLNSATEFATTLPAPTAGCKYNFIVKAAPSGASYTIITTGAETIKGLGFESEVDTSDDGPTTQGADTITLVNGVAVAGDRVDLYSDGTSWFSLGFTAADGGITYTSAI